MLGDFHIAEPGALIGFAGQRVIKQTIGEDLPQGFQTADFIMEHGFIDTIVNRQEMKTTLSQIIDLVWSYPTPKEKVEQPPISEDGKEAAKEDVAEVKG